MAELVILLRKLPFIEFLYPVLKTSAIIWMIGVGVLPFFTGSLGPDPLQWRAFSNSATSHHSLILLAYSVLFVLLWRRAKINPILGVAVIFMIVSVHELVWWTTDLLWMQSVGISWHWYWFFGYLLPPTLGCFLIYPQFVKFPWKILGTVIFFNLFWFAIGFPITVNYVPLPSGITSWYNTDLGDGMEILSWIIPMLVFWFFDKKGVQERQVKLISALDNVY